jgi:hypothetical protein
MTKDLALLVGRGTPFLTTEEFLAALDDNLRRAMNSLSSERAVVHASGQAPAPGATTSLPQRRTPDDIVATTTLFDH